MSRCRKHGGNLIVGHALAREAEYAVEHFYRSGELGDRVDLHLNLEIGYGADAPDDADQGDVVFAAVKHDLVDETAQQRLTLSVLGSWIHPDLRKAAGEADDLALQRLAHP